MGEELGAAVVGVELGVELAAGVGDVVALVRVGVGLGDGERLWVGRAWANVDAGAVAWWCGFTGLTCAGAGRRCAAGAPATLIPMAPVSAPAAVLAVASTTVVRRRRPP